MIVVVIPTPGVAQEFPMASSPTVQVTTAEANIIFALRNMDFLRRSALHWKDIAVGAQIERRSGAGPVRNLLDG